MSCTKMLRTSVKLFLPDKTFSRISAAGQKSRFSDDPADLQHSRRHVGSLRLLPYCLVINACFYAMSTFIVD